MLKSRHAAYVVMSGAGLACIPRATTDFVYVRMHGPDPEAMYAVSYPTEELRIWAGRIGQRDAESRDVWVYFSNDSQGHAVRNARALRDLLS